MKSIRERVRGSQLARHSAWALAGQLARVGAQALYFVLLARVLGASGIGAFVGAVSLVGVVVPFATLGSGNILVEQVARRPGEFDVYWGNALLTTIATGLALVALLMGVGRLLLPPETRGVLLLAIAVADLLFARLVELSGQAYQAVHRMSRAAQLTSSLWLARAAAAALFYAVARAPSPTRWSYYFLASSVLCGVGAVLLVQRELGAPRPDLARIPRGIRTGLYFSISNSAEYAGNDVDKTLLARLGSLDAVGIYSAAYRLIDAAFTPVRAVLYAAYARFFQHGEAGLAGSLAYARKLLPAVVGYSVGAALAILALAPLLPVVLGPQFTEAAAAARWLALLPVFKGLQFFAADTLSGAGHTALRSAVQVAGVVANVGANLLLIPAFSWRGAAWASLGTDAALALGLWGAVWWSLRRAPAAVRSAGGAAELEPGAQ